MGRQEENMRVTHLIEAGTLISQHNALFAAAYEVNTITTVVHTMSLNCCLGQ